MAVGGSHDICKKDPLLVAIIIFVAGTVAAAVPPDIAKELVNIGRGVCVPETTQIYLPLHRALLTGCVNRSRYLVRA